MSRRSQSAPVLAPAGEGTCGSLSPPQATSHSPEALAQIRHALRTPINHILGYCEMLLEESGHSDSFHRDLERIQSSGRQLLGLISEHFDGPPKEKGQLDFHRLDHDLRTPVNHIVGYCELLEEEIEAAGKTRFVPELKKIHEASLTWLALMEQFLHLRSSATIPPSDAPGILTAGTPTLLPRQLTAAKAKRPPSIKGSLLVVDDDADNRDLLARRLRRNGYQVTPAADGREALDLIHERPFDLVLLDLIMPGMNGLEVLKRVRRRWSTAELPVIVVTARDSSTEAVEALHLGANDFLTKPTEFTVVQARAETHLQLKRMQEKLKARMEQVRKLAKSLEKRNRFIRQVFGRYVTDSVVERLLETPAGLKLGGEKREVTVLMSDLRGFTSIAERLRPEQVVELLNIYLGEMTAIISSYEGIIEDFIGDGILAVFGAHLHREDYAARAAACALAMQLGMNRVNQEVQHLSATPLAMGIALNTGPVVVGNIGSATRAKFGVVGTTVNAAARLQAAAVGGQILATESTVDHVGPVLVCGDKKSIVAKGLTEPLKVYVVEGIGGKYNLTIPG